MILFRLIQIFRRSVFLNLLLFCITNHSICFAAGAPEDIAGAELAYAAEHWKVWRTSSVVAGTERNRAVTYEFKYYRQRLGTPKATLVYQESRTRGFKKVFTVFDDGTVFLCERGHVVLTQSPEAFWQPYFVLNGVNCDVLYADKQGMVIQPIKPDELSEAYYVAFENQKVKIKQLSSKIRITDGGIKVGTAPQFTRHGNLLAWLYWEQDLKSWGDVARSRFATFDLEKGTGSRVTLPVRSPAPMAFDGRTVSVDGHKFNAFTGDPIN